MRRLRVAGLGTIGFLLASAALAETLTAPPPAEPRLGTRQEAPPAFWIKVDGQNVGPLGLDMVKALVGAGQITGQTEVWTVATQAFRPATDYAELVPLLPAAGGAAPQAAGAQEPAGQQTAQGEAGQVGGAALAGAENPPPPPPAQVDEPPPPPPAPIVADAVKYYVIANGQTSGPFSIDEVKAKIADGSIKGLTLMWKKGMDGWEPAEKLPEVKLAIDETPKPAPFDCPGFVVGTWQRTSYFNGQTVTLVATYEANGQFVSVQTMAGLPGVTSYGTWTATAVGEKSCSLALSIKYPSTNTATTLFDIASQTMITDKSDGSQAVRIQ